MRRWAGAAVLVVLAAAVGCSDGGPKRYRLTGTVAFDDGTPIPEGEVLLTPDAAKKNTGPQGRAPIRDGKFDTDAGDGLGFAGGPTVIRVNGMSGSKTLCEYETSVELPRESGT